MDARADTATICTVDGKKQVKKGAASVDFEKAFSQARISILLYSTAGGDQTLISMDHLIEILDDKGKDRVTYKLQGGYTLEIDGGGPFPSHVKMANAAFSEYQQQQQQQQRAEAPIQASVAAKAPVSAIQTSPVKPMLSLIGAASCGYCGMHGAEQRCAGCKSVYYCSVQHQSLDWEARHQNRCDPVSK